MALERKLAFKDRFVTELTQVLETGDCEGSPLSLSAGVNTIILDLTEQQFIKIHSALMTGADLTYPSEAHQVVWWFTKGVTCAVDFCQRMIDCLENDEATREAMIQAMITELLADTVLAESFVSAMRQIGIDASGGNNQIGAPNAELSGRGLGNCDDFDLLYGQCYAWVGALNEIAEDVLQWIELATNDEELASLLADNVPGLGAIPASVLEFGLWLQEYVSEAYLSAWDTTTQEYWACKLFCQVAEGDCILTFENVHNAYATALEDFSPPAFTDNLADFLDWYVSLVTLSENEIVGVMHLFIMTVLERLGSIFGSTFRTIEIALQTADPITPECPCCTDIYLDFADDTTATPVYATGGIALSTTWQAAPWEGGLPAWRAGTQFFVEGSPGSRYGFLKITVDPDCFYVGYSVEMQITEINPGASNFSVNLYDTDTIPREADNYFYASAGYLASSTQYRTFADSFSPRKFPSGYIVIGFGTGGGIVDWNCRIKYLQFFT